MENKPSMSVKVDPFEASSKEIKKFLCSVDASAFSICAKLYEIINESETEAQAKLFEKAATLYGEIESNESLKVSSSPYESQEKSLEKQYGALVNSFIEFYIGQYFNNDIFYSKLWETIQSDLFFPDDAAKIFAFYYILIDKRIPYFELIPGYQMSNTSYKALRQKHAEELRKIRYINSVQFDQKTEHASLILNELGISIPESDAAVEVINNYEKMLIIMAEAINTTRPRAKSLDQLIAQIRTEEAH